MRPKFIKLRPHSIQVNLANQKLEYCGFNSFTTGSLSVTCTFITSQSGVAKHFISLAQIQKPTGYDLRWSATTWVLNGASPYTSSTITIAIPTSLTIKLGYFHLLIKNQPTIVYIDYVNFACGPTSAIDSALPTVRTCTQDININTLSLFTTADAGALLIVPFTTHYSFELTVPDDPANQYDFTYHFGGTAISSSTVRGSVTIQPTVKMQYFGGFFLLVNKGQIQAENTAYQANPTLNNPTNFVLNSFEMGNPVTGKYGEFDFSVANPTFGPSFNTKCIFGFEEMKYTQSMNFSLQLIKNSKSNFYKVSQTFSITKIPSAKVNFFCYGVKSQCADSTTIYDGMADQCYTTATCPLPIPGFWAYPTLCPWCHQLVCVSCKATNRSECNLCQPGTNTTLNPTTKQCDCNVGYYGIQKDLNPVTWNGQTKTLSHCAYDCSYAMTGCKQDKCLSSAYCTECQKGYRLYLNMFGQFCAACNSTIPGCAKCADPSFCDQCAPGFYINDIMTGVIPALTGRNCIACLLNCKTCTNTSECVTCFDGYELSGSKTSCTCHTGLSNLLNCDACTVNTSCTDCKPNFYIKSSDQLCETCRTLHPNCIDCSNQNTCISCDGGWGLDVSGAQTICSNCDKIVQYCDQCTTVNSCLHCAAPYGLFSPTWCKHCEIIVARGCIECLNPTSPCTKCNATSFLINGTCFFCPQQIQYCVTCQINTALKILDCLQCQVGYYLHYNPTKSHYECLLCRNAIHKCLACSDENTCTKCELPNLLGSTTKCDLCSPGFLNYDGYCMLEAGCMSVKEINFSEQICLSCRDYLNFVYEASSHQCICEKGFEMSVVMIEAEKKCISVCGDGILISKEEECDDGNLDSYDGCSNHCKVEEYFDCSKTSPSKCVLYKDVQSFQYLYIEKMEGQNQAVMHFSIQPKGKYFSKIDWKKLVSFNFTSTAVKVSSYSFTYSPQTGQLLVFLQYQQALQKLSISYTLSSDPSMFISNPPKVSYITMLKGINSPLTLQTSDLLDTYKLISTISFVFSILTLLHFFVGSYMNKMIGLETIQIFQLVYFVRSIVSTRHTTILTAFNNLKYTAMGITNDEFLLGKVSSAEKASIPTQFVQIGMDKYFLWNVNFYLAIIAVIMFLYTGAMIKKIVERTSYIKTKDLDSKVNYIAARKSTQRIYSNFIFPQMMFLSFVLCFSVVSQDFYKCVSSSTLDKFPISMIVQSVIQWMIGLIFSYEVINSFQSFIRTVTNEELKLSAFQQLESMKSKNEVNYTNYHQLYVFAYLVYYFLVQLAMLTNVQLKGFNHGLEIVLGLTVGYLVLIIAWKPYFKSINSHNGFLIINHFTAVALLSICLLFDKSNKLSSASYIISAYSIVSLLFIVLLCGYIRLYNQYQYQKKLGYRNRPTLEDNIRQEERQKLQHQMNRKQRKQNMLEDNPFTLSNQIYELKKAYDMSRNTIEEQNMSDEEYLIKKIQQDFKMKANFYNDMIDPQKQFAVGQQEAKMALKQSQKYSAKLEVQNKLQQQNDRKEEQGNQSKGKYSNREKQLLKRLKSQLRNQINVIDQQED